MSDPFTKSGAVKVSQGQMKRAFTKWYTTQFPANRKQINVQSSYEAFIKQLQETCNE